MAAGKREMVLAAMELAFERSVVAEELGLAILVQYVDIRMPEIFDGRRLRTSPLWDALVKEGLSEQDLQVPFLALKSWEAFLATVVELPVPLAPMDNEARARATAAIGIGNADVAKLIADRAEQLSASPAQLERERMAELLSGVSPRAAKPAAAAAEAVPASSMASLGPLGDRRIPLWAVATMIAILGGSGTYAYFYVREPPTKEMDPAELKPLLAVRDAQQKGAYFVATVDDPNWAKLSQADRHKRAQLLLDHLADSGVADMTLLDDTGAFAVRLNVHEPSGPPVAPAPAGAPVPAPAVGAPPAPATAPANPPPSGAPPSPSVPAAAPSVP